MSSNFDECLSLITEPLQLHKIHQIASQAVRCYAIPNRSDPGYPLKIVIFKLLGWVAVPIDGLEDNRWSLQNHVEEILKLQKYTKVNVLLLGYRSFSAYETLVNSDGIYEFFNSMGYYDCAVLFTGIPEPDFIIISIEYEMFIVAGLESFVSQVIDCSIEEGFAKFQTSFEDNPPGSYRDRRNRLYTSLQKYCQSSRVGEEFTL